MKISRINLRRLINEIVNSASGKAKVYHMFGSDRATGLDGIGSAVSKDQVVNRVKTIMRDGFKPSNGMYGKGLYGFDEDTFKTLNQHGNYGNYALEFEIKDITKYLIFDYEKAKALGKQNFKLIDQLKEMGIGPKDVLFTNLVMSYTPDGIKTSRGDEVTAEALSDNVDECNEFGYLQDNDELLEVCASLSEDKRIHGCFVEFFVCWNLESVILTGYCDDTSTAKVTPISNIL